VAPVPPLEIVPAEWMKLPPMLKVGVEVPLFKLKLPLTVKLPPTLSIGAAGELVLYIREPVPTDCKLKLPFTVVSNPKRLIATDWLAQFQVKLEKA